MDKKATNFQEQDAPLKNTDKAFVRVNEKGLPVIPEVSKEKIEKEGETNRRSDKEKK